MSASIDQGLRQARQAIIDAHSAAETAPDLDGVIATFHHPRYEIVPTGEVFDGEAAVRGYHGADRCTPRRRRAPNSPFTGA